MVTKRGKKLIQNTSYMKTNKIKGSEKNCLKVYQCKNF